MTTAAKRLQRTLPDRMPCPACGRIQPLSKLIVENHRRVTAKDIAADEARREAIEDERTIARDGLEQYERFKKLGVRSVCAADLEPEAREIRNTWRITCDVCTPYDGEHYWFTLDRCDDTDKALEWTTHLAAKQWFGPVNEGWFALLTRLFDRTDS